MAENPIDILSSVGWALRKVADCLDEKEEYGLGFIVQQLGDTAYNTGIQLQDEGWRPSRNDSESISQER